MVAGAVSMNADFVTLIESRRPRTAARKKTASPSEPQFATLTLKPWVPREELEPVAGPASGASLRQRVLQGQADNSGPVAEAAPAPVPAAPPAAPAPAPAPAPKRGWLSRLLSRFRKA
jgi:hypothetical protein